MKCLQERGEEKETDTIIKNRTLHPVHQGHDHHGI